MSVGELQGASARCCSVLLPAIVFRLSFTVVFVALGMTATGPRPALQDSRGTLDKIAGAVIIALGVLFLLTPFVPKLNREWRPEALISRAGSGGPLIAGAAFAFAWTPCIGPTLGAILPPRRRRIRWATARSAAVLLGRLSVPFLLTALAFTRAWAASPLAARPIGRGITAVSGLVLIAMGVLLLTGELTRLNNEAQQALDSLRAQPVPGETVSAYIESGADATPSSPASACDHPLSGDADGDGTTPGLWLGPPTRQSR